MVEVKEDYLEARLGTDWADLEAGFQKTLPYNLSNLPITAVLG